MPGVIGGMIERPKMTRSMYQALKRHILAEREKKKQGQWKQVFKIVEMKWNARAMWTSQILQIHCPCCLTFSEKEQDEEFERQKRERELRKKKAEEESLTLEQTKEACAAEVRKTQC